MPDRPRLVADTNVLVSRLLSHNSVAAQSVMHAMAVHQLIVSPETLQELETVLSRPRFNHYISLADRLTFFHLLRRTAQLIDKVPPITICRDPKDDKFLALAIAGRAKTILTGDQDLLVLHPFRKIEIIGPRQFLDQVKQSQLGPDHGVFH